MELIGVREDYGEQAWIDLKAKMNKREWSKNYQRYNFYVLKNLAKATKSNWPWHLQPPEKPQDRERNVNVMPKKDLKRAITQREEYGYNGRERFCLALSSVYGLRQIEIRNIETEHIDSENHRITIYTAKKNPKRTHYIPEPIRPIVYGYDPSRNLPSSRTVACEIFHNIFDPISEKIRNSSSYRSENPDPWGWHSIRRRIVTDLGSLREKNEQGEMEKVFDKEEIVNFMRWSQLDETMFSTYSYPEEELQEEDQINLDLEIFKKHPYLEFWSS